MKAGRKNMIQKLPKPRKNNQNENTQSENTQNDSFSFGKKKPSDFKTNTEKARYIFERGFSIRALSTLERLSTQELDFILENERDPEQGELDKNSAKFAKELISNIIKGLESIHEARGFTGGLNKSNKAFAESQAESLAPFLDSSKSKYFGLGFLAFAMSLLSMQAIFGNFENFKKWVKTKFSKDRQNENLKKAKELEYTAKN